VASFHYAFAVAAGVGALSLLTNLLPRRSR